MDTRKRNTSVDLNLQIKALQQDLEDLRQRLEQLENRCDQAEKGMDVELNDDTWPTGNYPF
ncbi:MAG: hypothetical protein ACOYEK_09215 [bacterium]|jgi:phage shock protein A